MTKSCSGNHTRQTKPKKGDDNQTPATSFSDGDTGQPAEKEPDVSACSSGSDFDLSEKIVHLKGFSTGNLRIPENFFYEKDVKTFIKKLKPLVNKYVKYTVDKMAMWDEIYKLAGENLSGRD